jgi:hypothetical protein
VVRLRASALTRKTAGALRAPRRAWSVAGEPASRDGDYGFVSVLVAIAGDRGVSASSARTRELLGWEPTHPGLIEDLDAGHSFR